MFIYTILFIYSFGYTQICVYLHIETKQRNKYSKKLIKTHDYEKKCITRDYEPCMATG